MTNNVQALKTFIWGILCCFFYVTTYGSQDSITVFMQQVANPSGEVDRSEAIQKLLQQDNPAVLPFLAAVQNSTLYIWKDELVVARKDADTPEGYMLLRKLYPTYTMVLDDEQQPLSVSQEELQIVPIARPDRLSVSGLGVRTNLFHPNTQIRAAAYLEALQSDDIAPELLSWALSHEDDPKVLVAGREAYCYFQMTKATTTSEITAWADSLYNTGGNNTLQLLQNFTKRDGLPEDASAYLLSKAEKLAAKSAWMERIQNAFSGLSLASILILISLGLGIVYGLAGIINMAHGEFLMIGAYATFSVQLLFSNVFGIQSSDWFFLAALPLSFIVAGSAGLLLERLVVRRLYAKPLDSLLATWGVSLILIQLARWIFGDMTAVKLPAILAGGIYINPQLVLPYNRLFIIVLTLIIVALVYWVLMHTRLGLQIRAVTQNRNMSACLGIDTKRVNAITFFMGSGLAGLAGCAMTLIGNVVPDMGQSYIVDSFLMVVIGGVGKIVGIIVSGLGIGISSKILEAFFEAVYGKVTILFIIMIFMQFRPKGLFPDKGRSAEE